MKEFDLESLSREMPYKMPEHFLDDMTERVVSQIGKQRKQNRERKIYALFASVASAAAVALLFLHPFPPWSPLHNGPILDCWQYCLLWVASTFG